MTETAKGKKPGFFGKDEDFGTRMDEQYTKGEQFIILSIEQDTPFVNPKTNESIKTRTKMTTRRFDPDNLRAHGLPVEVKTLGQVIYEHAGEQMPEDFPAVVFWTTVPVERFGNEAIIIRRVCPFPIPDDLRQYMTGE